MNLTARAPLLFAGLVVAMFLAGCSSSGTAEKQIRERILSIREAILAKRAEGIVEFGTPDWRFDSADHKSYDRASYLARTKKLFADVQIESLETRIDRIDRHDSRAEVSLTQTMIRTETDPSGTVTRWRVRYRERQEWIETAARGWLVTHVSAFALEREKLPTP